MNKNENETNLCKNIEQLTQQISLVNHNLETIENLDNKQRKTSNDAWISTQEVCKMLGIATRTLQKYRDEKYIPYSQILGKILYKKKDIDNLLQKNYQKQQD